MDSPDPDYKRIIFAATVVDAVHVQSLFRAANYASSIVICAATDQTPYTQTPYTQTPFIKLTGIQNIRRFLAPDPHVRLSHPAC